jgi:hypothetical protein
MPTLGPQIVTGSYGNLLKFLPTGEDGVGTGQIRISDGKGKPTPLFLATGSAYVSGTLSSSAEVVFSGLTPNAPGQYVSFDTTTGRLYYSTTSSIQNVVSASYAVTASYALNAEDGDWTIGSSYMTASGQDSVYIPNKLEQGNNNVASGDYSHAQGEQNLASGNHSHAEGTFNTSSGIQSHVEGSGNVSFGATSHAEGVFTFASGNVSHTEGQGTLAIGNVSHTEGQGTLAIGNVSHAEGYYTTASGFGSHTEGEYTRTDVLADYAHAEGQYTLAFQDYAHAEGQYTTASGVGSHAEGYQTRATSGNSHAEGGNTWAQGGTSHAEGYYTTSSGLYSHAEGMETRTTFGGGGVYNKGQHAEGYKTLADKNFSHAEGMYTTASGVGSHAGGYNTNAILDNQTVVGQYNKGSYPGGLNDTFVVGVGGNSNHLADGLKVRQTFSSGPFITFSEGAVIAQRTTFPFGPGASGFYLGEPEVIDTIRFVNDTSGNQLLIQRRGLADYTTLITVTSTANEIF